MQQHMDELSILDTRQLKITLVYVNLTTIVWIGKMYMEEMYGSVSGIKPAEVIYHVSLEIHHPKTLFQIRAGNH
jgi:hypothetical protein